MSQPTSILAKNLDDTARIAKEVLGNLGPRPQASVLALSGDLGAGKTAFTKELAHLLGIAKDDVTSPTFVIEKIYEINHPYFKHLIHIDAYRLESEDELVKLGWHEIVADPENLIVIEWPQRIPALIPEDAVTIHLASVQGDEREITLS